MILTRCSFSAISYAERDEKLVKLDEGTIQDLIGELEAENDKENEAAATLKAKNKVQARLAHERKAAAKKASQTKKGKQREDDDDDEVDDLTAFVKGGAAKQKKSK
jgi:predicted component of type VI protein secretion system